MFALVEDGSITKYYSGNRGFTLNGNQYSKQVFTLWSKSEREAIGIYKVVWDTTNKKDETWYINTDPSYAFANGKVTASYGSATAKAHADTLFTADDEDNGLGTEGEVKVEGLKTIKIREVKKQADEILAETDWYIIRKADASTAVPSAITNHRAAVRTKCAQMETAITNASNTAAIEALYTYNDDNPPTRPLGELPRLET
jgi:hypothetical protein